MQQNEQNFLFNKQGVIETILPIQLCWKGRKKWFEISNEWSQKRAIPLCIVHQYMLTRLFLCNIFAQPLELEWIKKIGNRSIHHFDLQCKDIPVVFFYLSPMLAWTNSAQSPYPLMWYKCRYTTAPSQDLRSQKLETKQWPCDTSAVVRRDWRQKTACSDCTHSSSWHSMCQADFDLDKNLYHFIH